MIVEGDNISFKGNTNYDMFIKTSASYHEVDGILKCLVQGNQKCEGMDKTSKQNTRHIYLTHISLTSFLWDIGKQRSPGLLTGISSKNENEK